MSDVLPAGVSAGNLTSHYRDVRKKFEALRPPAKVIPIGVVPFEAPAVQVEPPKEPVRPYIVPREYPTTDDVFEETRQFYGLSKVEFLADRRFPAQVLARQIAMHLCRTLTLKSYPVIARELGGRDHTTCIHGCRKIERLMATDERLCDEIQLITIRINERVAARNAALAVRS